MARLLAIDYGRKRSGIAVSDSLQIIANGLTTVPSHSLIAFLKDYVAKESVERIIIGMPRQMNYEESESMQYIKPFVKKLENELPAIPLVYFDERFTSKMAHQTMIDGGLKKKQRQNKALVDEISATIILQGYMESQRMTML
ncbi:MAG: Holliday junction resolvase RuvX [Candidatus Saccharimonadaceae bacterium]